jgi:hypothetical protein
MGYLDCILCQTEASQPPRLRPTQEILDFGILTAPMANTQYQAEAGSRLNSIEDGLKNVYEQFQSIQ